MDGEGDGDLLGLFSKGDALLPPVHEEYDGSKYAMITKNGKNTSQRPDAQMLKMQRYMLY
jgi:hypothetical protein